MPALTIANVGALALFALVAGAGWALGATVVARLFK
jgi:hypothetical protein